MNAWLLPVCTVLIFVLLPSAGFAADTVIGDAFCNVVSWMNGRTGKALVILAMTITGILALFNKLSWEKAVMALVAETVVLKAPDMVSAISSGGADC